MWLRRRIRAWLFPDQELKDWFQRRTSYSLDEFWEIYNQILLENELIKGRLNTLERRNFHKD